MIVTHGYELIARSHEEWAWPPHGSFLYDKLVVVRLILPFSGLRTRLTETQDREQTFEGVSISTGSSFAGQTLIEVPGRLLKLGSCTHDYVLPSCFILFWLHLVAGCVLVKTTL